MRLANLILPVFLLLLSLTITGCNLFSSKDVYTYQNKNVAYADSLLIDDFLMYRDGVLSLGRMQYMARKGVALEFFYKRKNGVVKCQVKWRLPNGKFQYIINVKDLPYQPIVHDYNGLKNNN